jgi:RES domain-containing protein
MPALDPPRPYVTELRHITVSAGQPMWRVTPLVHLESLFRTDVVDVKGDGKAGGRFDPGSECLYPYTYVALDPLTAIAETMLRSVGYQAAGRLLHRAAYTGRAVSILEPTRELSLISLLEAGDLAAARQDSWLVHAEPRQYPRTRRWGYWFRECSRRADGIIWPSKRHPHGKAVLLFGDPDRCGTALQRAPFGHRALDTEDGEHWLAGLLRPLQTYLRGT